MRLFAFELVVGRAYDLLDVGIKAAGLVDTGLSGTGGCSALYSELSASARALS